MLEENSLAIVRLGWSRHLGLDDSTLAEAVDGPALRVERNTVISWIELAGARVLVGPDWFLAGGHPDPVDAAEVLRRAVTRGASAARLLGSAVIACTDRYLDLPGLESVAVSDEPEALAAIQRQCPPDDVAESGLSAMDPVLVVLDDDDTPLAAAGYEPWEGFIAQLGALTPPARRRGGAGRTAAALATHDALDSGLVPQWRSRRDNVASQALGRSLGYQPIGEQTTLLL